MEMLEIPTTDGEPKIYLVCKDRVTDESTSEKMIKYISKIIDFQSGEKIQEADLCQAQASQDLQGFDLVQNKETCHAIIGFNTKSYLIQDLSNLGRTCSLSFPSNSSSRVSTCCSSGELFASVDSSRNLVTIDSKVILDSQVALVEVREQAEVGVEVRKIQEKDLSNDYISIAIDPSFS